ncbi:hypothetical protein ADT26_15425 [Xanthomonas oryzae]|nr:hypothetical protein AXO1947_13685 [Xanthomonas oryzae pv. oryzae]KOR41548.1 hypothetical protein ADT26_15425 [Xanthomonas oryzae]AUI90070.1 hypothetical protein BVV16_07460 [Xanthomonas oryzae pv. oryzae]AUI93749.1 hypothetical protein BVV17_07470 [Xanthomonas oryzae pv. oryzae]AUI97418.1 hypothetical protein BVV18_07480 [Xanthomonas oryzae pv. oryzae]
MLVALGACTAITVSMLAARKQWPLTAVHVHLHDTQRGAAGTTITREIVLEGALDDEQRARLMEVADTWFFSRLRGTRRTLRPVFISNSRSPDRDR